MRASVTGELRHFYGERQFRPLWLTRGTVSPEAVRLMEIIRAADIDGLDNAQARAGRIEDALIRAQSGSPQDLAQAELVLSQAWVDSVQTLRRPADVGMIYAEPSLAPVAPSAAAILTAAAIAPSLTRHLDETRQLNPVYGALRDAALAWRGGRGGMTLAGSDDTPSQIERRLWLNLERARALPATTKKGRYVLVDAAAARLYLYEDGKPQDSMRVIVGRPGEATPMIAGMLRTATLNPYWNVPPDLVRRKVAPQVLEEGTSYLSRVNYEVLSDWTEDATVLDPDSINWKAVAAGEQEVRVRQLPGPGNGMGEMKFMFPNAHGIYLHDTPDKTLFDKDDRTASAGCVRLEDARKLARWLFGRTPRSESDAPEQSVGLPEPVPVYITYFTVGWDGSKLAVRRDPYGRDADDAQRFASRVAVAAE